MGKLKFNPNETTDKTQEVKDFLTEKRGAIIGVISAIITITGYENLPIGKIVKLVLEIFR